jgi:hypothetical protein
MTVLEFLTTDSRLSLGMLFAEMDARDLRCLLSFPMSLGGCGRVIDDTVRISMQW